MNCVFSDYLKLSFMFTDKRGQCLWYARSECFPNKLSRCYSRFYFLAKMVLVLFLYFSLTANLFSLFFYLFLYIYIISLFWQLKLFNTFVYILAISGHFYLKYYVCCILNSISDTNQRPCFLPLQMLPEVLQRDQNNRATDYTESRI